ncbi:hypothetical protein JCM10369A_25890 [Nocardioides pyridinolyticus]
MPDEQDRRAGRDVRLLHRELDRLRGGRRAAADQREVGGEVAPGAPAEGFQVSVPGIETTYAGVPPLSTRVMRRSPDESLPTR